MHLSMVCPRMNKGGQANPCEFGHFSFKEDNFPTLGSSVKFLSLLEAFLDDFWIIFQNGGQKEDHYRCQNPFPGGAFSRQVPEGCVPPILGQTIDRYNTTVK